MARNDINVNLPHLLRATSPNTTNNPAQHSSSHLLSLTMLDSSSISSRNWPGKVVEFLISTTSLIVFTFLDLFDFILCYLFKFLDSFVEEESATQCYCHKKQTNRGKQGRLLLEDDDGCSETLYQRKNLFRDLGIWKNWSRARKREDNSESGGGLKALKRKWSDCNCDSCLSWQQQQQQNGDDQYKLHFVVMEPPSSSSSSKENTTGKQVENVIFLHGFLNSSTFWVESVFPNISETGKHKYKLFAVDLLGFGKSPKPWECLYTVKDHVERIEQSVITPFDLKSFHIVAHSMGCIIALGLASKHLKSVKSITLVAPPYYPSSKEEACLNALNRLADRRLWPPMLFASSVMSWYEHLGRCVCLIYCRNHQTWERILKLLLRTRDLHFIIIDTPRHTHHSAWHSMHNVLCGGAKLMPEYFEAINKSEVLVTLILGEKDSVTPLQCTQSLKSKMPLSQVHIISNTDHNSVIFGRKQEFTRDLEHIWLSASR